MQQCLRENLLSVSTMFFFGMLLIVKVMCFAKVFIPIDVSHIFSHYSFKLECIEERLYVVHKHNVMEGKRCVFF